MLALLTLVQSSGPGTPGGGWVALLIDRRHASVVGTVLETLILQNVLVVVLDLGVQERFQGQYAFSFQFSLEYLVFFLVVGHIREELFDGPLCG
jgi:hypothetical protein